MSQCASGAGRFVLIPHVFTDRDADGDRSVILRPHQLTGTGALTGHAWLTSITPVGGWDAPTKLVRKNRKIQFDDADLLVGGAATAVHLPAQGLTAFPGAFSGAAPFVWEDAPPLTSLGQEVDLAWTCGELDEDQEISTVLGFSFTLAELGCATTAPQRFTVRPRPMVNPTTLELEPYGQLGWRRTVSLTPSGAGYAFDAHVEKLVLKGRVEAWTSSAMTISLEEATWDGAAMCTPGTYFVGPE